MLWNSLISTVYFINSEAKLVRNIECVGLIKVTKQAIYTFRWDKTRQVNDNEHYFINCYICDEV